MVKECFVKVGDKFGQWTVIQEQMNRKALCKCSCGSESMIKPYDLVKKYSTKCNFCRKKCLVKSTSVTTGYLPHRLYSHWKRNAKVRNLEFSISIEFLNNLLIKQNFRCNLSNVPLNIEYELIKFTKSGKKRNNFDFGNTTLSLDRVNSSIGYTEENVQFVHKHVNMMKWNFDQEMFLSFCNAIAKNNVRDTNNFNYIGKLHPENQNLN